jgi:lysophospholipase L1-like esterase
MSPVIASFIPAPNPYPFSISAIDLGVAGATSTDVVNSAAGSTHLGAANADKKGWYVLWIGTNDLNQYLLYQYCQSNPTPSLCAHSSGNSAGTQGQLETNISNAVSPFGIVQQAHNMGFQVMILTLPDNLDSYFTTQYGSAIVSSYNYRAAFNYWLTGSSSGGSGANEGSSGASYVCDVAQALANSTPPPGTSFVSGDGLHLTQAAYNVVAAQVKSCLAW